MLKHLRPALAVWLFMTLLCGAVYPLLITLVAQLAMPEQANGSLIYNSKGEVLGSQLLAQPVNGPRWFQPRPSAADYATVPSGASNLAPSNPALAARIAASAAQWQAAGDSGPVPMQLVTTSGSGLDPHLSPAAAAYQVPAIAAARQIPASDLQRLIQRYTEQPLLGPPVVNVLSLNLALMDNRLTSRSD
ncbi:potassium-transporting ATPase subunit KdpC [Pseudomonas sp. 5P_3.1_Bac2]|uniref:potassium-transporting ATPase subunit KdpC n=1 Tax=Pseudomonas sp. 5P_3.1_Bac2 TaxID=2971617 RepID=UPI0021C7FDB8|nr:potassium-transporting ATPase subunit KdpC [Pseudomonas sp. 5P_3.1_Bac2]MCU1716955.1 potassium-transporting ATPase subunit KdpC [Pseudomonas sp. 5P_3.1_Bac2]